MLTVGPSYFDFLMKYRRLSRARVPFAEAVGVMPELTHLAYSRTPRRTPAWRPGARSLARPQRKSVTQPQALKIG
jgi:hypothetical protein